MNSLSQGRYRVLHIGKGSRAAVATKCPACATTVRWDLAKSQVHPTPKPFEAECPNCGKRYVYAPQA